MNIKVDWDIDPEDVDCNDEYSSYRITEININDDTKEIWSITYSYSWACGDGCCSSDETGTAYVGQLSEGIKKRLSEEFPDYKLQSFRWGANN